MTRTMTDNKLPNIDTLMIDQDCIVPPNWLQQYVNHVIIPICNAFDVTVQCVKFCLSATKGIHLYIKIMPPVDDVLALKLQYLLGDDRERVSKNRARIRAGLPNWNKLFDKESTTLRTLYRNNLEVNIPEDTKQTD